MTRSDEKASNLAGELHVGDAVRLREPLKFLEAGTRGRVIGFYGRDPREALLVLDDGRELRVPYQKLEQVR